MSFPSRMRAREFEVFCAVAYRISSITIAPIRHVCTLCVIYFLRDDDAGLQHCTYVHTILVDCERLAVIVKRGKSRLKTADYTNRLFYDLTWDIFFLLLFFLSPLRLFSHSYSPLHPTSSHQRVFHVISFKSKRRHTKCDHHHSRLKTLTFPPA